MANVVKNVRIVISGRTIDVDDFMEMVQRHIHQEISRRLEAEFLGVDPDAIDGFAPPKGES